MDPALRASTRGHAGKKTASLESRPNDKVWRSVMMRIVRVLCLLLAAALLLAPATACESSTHTVTRTTTYDDEPQQKRSESDQLDSGYKMQSEGEMKGR